MADEVIGSAVPEAPAVAPAVAPPAAPAAPPAEAKPETRRDIIARELKNPTPRRPNGQFLPASERNAEPGAQLPSQTAPTAPQRPKMPKSLRLELQSHWEAAHPELANAVAQREVDYEKGVEPLKAAKREYDAIMKEFEPYQGLLKHLNSTPQQAIAPLLQTAAVLRTGTPEQKAFAVVQTMQQFGIPLQTVLQMLQNSPAQPRGPSGPLQQVDPQFLQIRQELDGLKQQQQQQETARSLAVVQEFAAKPEHKHFEAVQDRMLAFLQNPAVLGPEAATASDARKLELAYDAAIRMEPAIWQQVQAETEAAQRQKALVANAKKAAVQVHGAPASGPSQKVDPKDRRSLIRAALAANR